MAEISFNFNKFNKASGVGKVGQSQKIIAVKTAGKGIAKGPSKGPSSGPSKGPLIPSTSAKGFGQKVNLKNTFKQRQTNSFRSGLFFPVGRVLSKMRKSRLSDRVSKISGIYLTAVLEYMISELVELSGSVVKQQKKKFIFPRHVYLGIDDDDEMKRYLGTGVILPTVGRKVYLHPFLKVNAKERGPQKNFMVVDKNLKNLMSYTKQPTQASKEQRSDNESD